MYIQRDTPHNLLQMSEDFEVYQLNETTERRDRWGPKKKITLRANSRKPLASIAGEEDDDPRPLAFGKAWNMVPTSSRVIKSSSRSSETSAHLTAIKFSRRVKNKHTYTHTQKKKRRNCFVRNWFLDLCVDLDSRGNRHIVATHTPSQANRLFFFVVAPTDLSPRGQANARRVCYSGCIWLFPIADPKHGLAAPQLQRLLPYAVTSSAATTESHLSHLCHPPPPPIPINSFPKGAPWC